jgi:hypothetical protein
MRDRRAKRPGWRACRTGSATGSLALLLVACGGTDSTPSPAAAPGGSSDESPPGRFQRVICPQCVRAGGETSDFGDGSAYLMGGAGIFPVPTPCEASTTASSIELDAARALGFGAPLDRLDATFDLTLEWGPGADDLDRPARGYVPSTRVRGTTRVLSAAHQQPSLEGCTDSLLVQVATTLETDDGALSIAGTLRSTLERDTRRPLIEGALDLSRARGTLEVDPPPSSETVLGNVNAFLYAWPDGMRLSLDVVVADARVTDTPSYFYQPLSARAPIDGCNPRDRPLAFDEATPNIGQLQSLADRFPELLALINTPQPLAAAWMDGAQTSLNIDVGEPLALCEEEGAPRLSGRVPYRVRSADGRVDIDSEAEMQILFVDGALGAGWFDIYHYNAVHPAASFAERTGISGVDFGAYGGGMWHTELEFDPAAPYPLSGEVTIDAVDIDGSVTGIPTAIIDSIDRLGW